MSVLLLFLGMTVMQSQKANQSSKPANNVLARAVKVLYTNWRGQTAERTIVPISIYWGKTEWHPHEQWLMTVWDLEREAYRDYALKDIKEWL